VYFGEDGDLVVVLNGGDKSTQQKDSFLKRLPCLKGQRLRFLATAELADPQIAEAYLNDALQDDDPQTFLRALLNVTQAQQNVAAVAEKAGVKRETIYRAFSKSGNPTLDTLNSVLQTLGLRIQVSAKKTGLRHLVQRRQDQQSNNT
jgi:probable addiction module antidote protein